MAKSKKQELTEEEINLIVNETNSDVPATIDEYRELASVAIGKAVKELNVSIVSPNETISVNRKLFAKVWQQIVLGGSIDPHSAMKQFGEMLGHTNFEKQREAYKGEMNFLKGQ